MGATDRTGIDTALHRLALVSATDPGQLGAGRGWIDGTGKLRVRNDTDTGWIVVGGGTIPTLDAIPAAVADVNIHTHKLTNVTNPSGPQDAATKAYVDAAGGPHLVPANNLSDVGSVNTSRANLGLWVPRAFHSVTANYAMGVWGGFILADATAGPISVTLPTLPGGSIDSPPYCVKKVDASVNAVTVLPTGGSSIDTQSSHVLAAQYDAASLVFDGVDWWIT